MASSRTKEGLPKYKSKFERNVGDTNPYLVYEPEKFSYTRDYRPDFRLTTRRGKTIYIECKGYFRVEDRTKILAVKRSHPDMDLRMLFLNAHQQIPGGKATNAEWCETHNIPWAQGTSVPLPWLEE